MSGKCKMPNGKAYAKVWLAGSDGEIDERCPTDFQNDCGGWVWHSNREARTMRGTQTRARCTRICSENIQYASGQNGNPCDGASTKRHIDPSENLNDGASGALECTWNDVTADKLKTMSGNTKNTNSSMGTIGSVYEQLLFGIRLGGYNTERNGFCEDVNNLEKIVDRNGDTCYDKIVAKLGGAVAKQKGIDYCQIDANKTDPKCKCINVSGSNFVQSCRDHPTWAGCSDIIAAADSYASVGVLQSITGLSGGADCLVPGICSGDVYEPQTVPQSCANQIGICDQVLNINVNQIDEAAELAAFQGCNIQFQTVRDRANSTSGSPSGIPSVIEGDSSSGDSSYPPGFRAPPSSTPDTSFRSKLPEFMRPYVPVTFDEIRNDSNKQLGVGGFGAVISSILMVLLLLIVSSGSTNTGGGRFPGRFRRG